MAQPLKIIMKKIINTIENETSKWFRRIFGICISLIVLAMFFFGIAFIASAVIAPTVYSILLFIVGVALISYSCKSIDRVLIMFGYKKESQTTTVKTRSIKKSK